MEFLYEHLKEYNLSLSDNKLLLLSTDIFFKNTEYVID